MKSESKLYQYSMHTILAKRCVEFQRQRVFEFRKISMETQPVRLSFESRGCDPGVLVSLQIVHLLIVIMKRKQAVYEELWWCSISIGANFLKDFDHALSFKLRSALYCPIIGSPLPIYWCHDSATEIGRKIVKNSTRCDFFFKVHNA